MQLLVFSILVLMVGCATPDPYQGCYSYQDESVKENCIQNVRQQQMSRAQMWSQMQQKNQIQQQQVQEQNTQLFQKTYKTPIQTHCTTIGSQTNCNTY